MSGPSVLSVCAHDNKRCYLREFVNLGASCGLLHLYVPSVENPYIRNAEATALPISFFNNPQKFISCTIAVL